LVVSSHSKLKEAFSMDGALETGQQIRLLLREYEQLLRQYSDAATDNAAELNDRMKTIFALQASRQEVFDSRFATEPDEWEFFDVDNGALAGQLRVFRADLASIPSFPNLPQFEGPFLEERRFYLYAEGRIEGELRKRGAAVERRAEPDPVAAVAEQIRRQVETEARLRQQCEEDVQKYPDQEESIRRSYRRAIDALREQ
jgi:hypothetical protein